MARRKCHSRIAIRFSAAVLVNSSLLCMTTRHLADCKFLTYHLFVTTNFKIFGEKLDLSPQVGSMTACREEKNTFKLAVTL